MLSKNFEKEMLRREKPKCYGKRKDEIEKDGGKKKCGTCWFGPYCKEGKELPKKSEAVATSEDGENKPAPKKGIFNK